MIFRLDDPRDNSEKVFGGAGHSHHSVAFKLTEIYDNVRFVKISRISEAFQHLGIGKFRFLLRKIGVQGRTVRLHVFHSRNAVHTVDECRRVKSSGTVTDSYRSSVLAKQLCKRRKQNGVRGCRLLGLHSRNEICLDDNVFAVEGIKSAERIKKLGKSFLCLAYVRISVHFYYRNRVGRQIIFRCSFHF